MPGWIQIYDKTGESAVAGNSLNLSDLFAGSALDRTATIQGSTSLTTIKLDASADSTNDAYRGYNVFFKNKNTQKAILSYEGGTKIATLTVPFAATSEQPTSSEETVVFSSIKMFALNAGARQRSSVLARVGAVGTNDGFSRIRFKDDTGTMIPPYLLTATSTGSTGAFPSPGTYGYRVSGLRSTGETQGGIEVTVSVTSTFNTVVLAWTNPSGSTGVKVYRTSTPGSYIGSNLISTLGVVTTYTDNGTTSATSTDAVPAANTTYKGSPNYGYPPTLGTTALTIGTLEKQQGWVFWMRRDTPIGGAETGNPRLATIEFVETS